MCGRTADKAAQVHATVEALTMAKDALARLQQTASQRIAQDGQMGRRRLPSEFLMVVDADQYATVVDMTTSYSVQVRLLCLAAPACLVMQRIALPCSSSPCHAAHRLAVQRIALPCSASPCRAAHRLAVQLIAVRCRWRGC